MRTGELTALLICPDRDLAQMFVSTLGATKAFRIVADLKSYPAMPALEVRLRQVQPDVVLIDLATDLDAACKLIEQMTALPGGAHAVGLHRTNELDAIVRSLRSGSSEFLHAPFDTEQQQAATGRLARLRAPEVKAEPQLGRVIAFASTKPGSGASTLAAQAAFALKRRTNQRVLLIDFDLMGGTIAFYLKLNHPYSLVDAIENSARLNSSLWSTLTVSTGGIDILPAPEAPTAASLSPAALHEVLQYARMLYDWIVLDLPAVFHRLALQALPESELTFLVSTSELPSLHLARKAAGLMNQLGVPRENYQMVVNRVSKRDNISSSDLEKIFNCPIEATFPNDYFSLHRVVTLGQPLGAESDLGRAVDALSARITARHGHRPAPGAAAEARAKAS